MTGHSRRARRDREAALDEPLAASQERSRETTERLLGAAEHLMQTGGADAATLRAIADEAGVSLGIVYRRFPDKDAVLRAVYVRFFGRIAEANERALRGRLRVAGSLEAQVGALVRGIADGYHRNRSLLRALMLYARTHPDANFRRRAAALNQRAFADMHRLLEPYRNRIVHRDPEAAIRFAITTIAATLGSRILFHEPAPSGRMSRARLVCEATRMFVSYLTAEHHLHASAARAR